MIRVVGMFFSCLCFFACNNASSPPTNSEEQTPWALLPFEKADTANPVLLPDTSVLFNCPINGSVRWEEKDVFNPAAIIRSDTLFLLYRAEDNVGKYAGTSRVGIAWSTDGLRFTKHSVPVLYPDNDSLKKYEWEGGCEDPRIVEAEDGKYYLTYTAYDGDKARLLVAVSGDLYHWEKKGIAFAKAYNGKYINEWSKSGAIVCKYVNGSPVAIKINGKYWMYWGDTNVFLAHSDDLINWVPVETSDGKLQVAFGPRQGKFDSDLVEPGPAAMLTPDGILLIYNCRNVPARGDTSLAEGTYAPSQILFDKTDPSRVLKRMDTWFMKPDRPYEISGQVNHVCFAEGLVQYKNKWFLYYGTADSRIAVAVK